MFFTATAADDGEHTVRFHVVGFFSADDIMRLDDNLQRV